MRLNPSVRTQLRFDGENTTYNYVGEAPVGSTTTSANWRIYRLENSGTASLIKMWADGSDQFNKVWDNRASYTY